VIFPLLASALQKARRPGGGNFHSPSPPSIDQEQRVNSRSFSTAMAGMREIAIPARTIASMVSNWALRILMPG